MRKALWLFTSFAVLASLPCFATAVSNEPVPVDPLAMAEELYPGIPIGATDGAPYSPIPEDWELECCTAVLTGPWGDNEMILPFTGTFDATEEFQYGNFYLDAAYTDPSVPDYHLSVEGVTIPLDTVPEPALGLGVGIALVAFITVWEFRRRKAARDRKSADMRRLATARLLAVL
jgi:hypothetical protein